MYSEIIEIQYLKVGDIFEFSRPLSVRLKREPIYYRITSIVFEPHKVRIGYVSIKTNRRYFKETYKLLQVIHHYDD